MQRAELIEKLRSWEREEASAEDMWLWACKINDAGGIGDELVVDILDVLAGMPAELIIAADAQFMIDALSNPIEETDLSVNLLWNCLDMIDLEARRTSLRNDPFYGPYTEAD